MKQILIAVLVVLLVGGLGFLYRYEIEKSHVTILSGGSGAEQACTEEARVCPDGSAVGRTGPHCSFAVCPAPNAELVSASSTLDFVLPSGYKQDTNISSANIIASYSNKEDYTSASSTPSTITISAFTIAPGQTAGETMLANTTFDPSGLQATSTSEFKSVGKGRNTFYEIQIGRFEGQVQTAYYLYQPTQIIRFDIAERGVQNWTDPKVNIDALPQHQSFLQMLATLVVSNA
jgi:hypothetical protein